MYQPDGLLTLGSEHDVGLYPYIIAPDPCASDECLDVSPSPGPIALTATTMGDDETPSGLNGRLRPRKSLVRKQQIQPTSKSESKVSPDKQRRTSTPSKASPNKYDDLVNKSEFSQTLQFLCPYCEKKFVSKQTMSKHARRMHLAVSKQGSLTACLFCNHAESNATTIIRHMVDCHPNQYFACFDCNSRFSSASELAEHKLNICEKQKASYRSKLRQKISQGIKKRKKSVKVKDTHIKSESPREENSFNGIVISCELKPSLEHNAEDIEDNITTNLILPPSKSLGSSCSSLEKSAVIILDDIQWTKRIPPNFNFHNTDADQILSRLGVVHKSPRTGESTKKDWLKSIDESSLKFEKCFDTTFYSKVSSNVQENLSKFLDGSFNFNPDPESVIKTRKSKKSVVINTAEGFPILLACEQYSRNIYDGYLPRSLAPRHKWIRDNIENERSPINPDQIKRDSHVNNCIITLVSGLDIWTQLCMRRKFEDKNRSQVPEKKVEKRTNVRKELEDILESRELPSSSQVEKPKDKLTQSNQGLDFPASLGLVPSATSYEVQPAVLSGEWVRPRCYVCCACGAQTRDPRTLTSHIATRHPNAQVQHYEIVGEVLLNADILKHLYIPPSQISNRTRPLRGFRECTKCMKSISLEDLHQHMLDCAGDTPAVRRRQGRRPFGVRRRRPRLADNTVRRKIRKDIRTRQRRQKNMIRPRQKIRTEVGDAETIRKMLADLPAKRHRVLINPLNHMTRPRVKRDNQKKKIMMKKLSSDDKNIKEASGSKDNIGNVKIDTNNPRSVASNSNTNDDNKSLRSKISRVVVKSPRQSQRVKRNANMSRIKRKSVRLREQQIGKKNAGISQHLHTELSNDDSLKKMDIKGTGYKTREHANRTGSNNRSEQKQGCSRSNSNSNNSVEPIQGVPLKHSIARLTANSETHDKSVQFHHLFLVQQECNNVNHQHMPSEERTLFENEDVIVRFDKPPLNFCQKSSQDIQKNKMSKPRKGLNDCIAMLRHKLLDPVPSEVTGHVSVQCGGDEPLDFDVLPAKQTTLETDNDTLRTDLAKNNGNLSELLRNSEQLATSTTINEISKENENSKCSETVTVEQKEKDLKLAEDYTKLVPEKETFTQRLNESSHKIVPEECIELNLNSENSTSGNNYIPSTTEDIDSQNTLNQDSFDNSFQISTKYSEFEATCKNNKPECEHLNKMVLTSGNNETMITLQKDMLVSSEMDFTQKLQVEIFSQPREFENMPTAIPPAHASTNVAPMLTIPLDLSSKLVSSNNQITVHKNYNSVESYDDNETLDLSNKTSFDSDSVNNDDVVDLRVKPLLPEYHHSVNLCLKSCIKDTQNLKDLSDNIPTDLSVKGKATDARSDNCQYERMLLIQDLSSHSKIIQNSRLDPSVLSVTASQNCPTDLSSKTSELSVSNIEQSNINSKDVESSRNIQNSPSKINESIPISTIKVYSHTNLISTPSDNMPQLNQNLEAVHSQKSNVYDSALVIPQYKIKATSTKQANMPVKTCVTDSFDEYPCSSNNVPNIITSSSSLGSFTKTSVHMSVKSQDSFGDTLSSTIISKSVTDAAGSLSDTEGRVTAPLCISSSSSVPITTENTATNVAVSSSQSTIGTTVVSSTTIYTTSVEVPSNYKTCLENKVMTVMQEYRMDTEDENISKENYKEEKIEKQKDSCTASSSDQDPETARKIAMLPKELVEIIGNIPADHRNQLLNVLPQYVSTSSASCIPHNETEKGINLEPLAIDTSQIESNENKESSTQLTSGLTAQESLVSKQSLPSPKCSDQIPQLESSHALPQFSISPTNDKIRKTLFNTECVLSSKDNVKVNKDHHLEGPYMPLVSNTMNTLVEYDKNGEKTVDLTDEENSVLSTDAVKVVKDLSNAFKLSTLDIPTFTSVEKPDRAKLHSEKTASLRAVRIKAPAERQKENQLLKRMSVEQQCKLNISDSDENEVNKSLESNTSLAIQQAEISSTQSNKNVQPNMNNEPESNGDESLRSPMDTMIESKDAHSHETLTKSAVVTSSIAMNDTTREVSNEINVNKSLSTEDITKEFSDDSAKKCVKEDLTAITTNSSIIAIELKQKINKTAKFITETKKRKVQTHSKNKTERHENLTAIIDDASGDAKKRKVHTHSKNETEISESITAINDDDSEDDICLASILKQKKNSVKKIKHKKDNLPDVTNAVVAKNDKELDNNHLKTVVYDGKAQSNKNEIIKTNKRTRNLKNSVCDSRVLAETANVVNQNSKKKTKKRYNTIEPAFEPAFEKSDTVKNIKEKIGNSQPNVINICEQGNENTMLVGQDVQKSKINVAKDKPGTVQRSTEMEMQKHSTIDNSSSNLRKDILSTVQKENINKSVTQTKTVCKSASKDKFDDLCTTEQERVLNESISSVSSTVVLEQNAKCFSKPIEDESHSQIENSKNKKVKLSSEIESTQDEVLNEGLKMDDHISTPLRRSRRGKSLYTENITDSLIPSDTSVDHKTPLTKKQLIFSKLQLDEETLAKQTEIYQNKEIFVINPAKVNEDCVKKYEEKIISSSEFKSKILIDKVKGTKRRKTHQIKGKCKKKKSLDSSPGPKKDNKDLILKSIMDTVPEPNIKNHNIMPEKHNIQEIIEKQTFDIKSKENKGKAASENNSTRKGKQIVKITEKRECNPLKICDDGHIAKPKKKKLQLIRDNKKYDKNFELDSVLNNEVAAETNIPVASRRTRSKSVIVKSLTSDSYDPYNIDFDISEKAEPFRKALKQMKVVNEINEVNRKTENDFILTEKEISTVDSEIPIPAETEKPKRNFGMFKTEPLSVSAKYDEMIINDNICHCDAQAVESKRKTSVAENLEENINDDLSYSDDSSKSDVPLKKYLEGKERRMMAEKEDSASLNTEPKKTQEDQKMNVVESVSETEEQLRSEQFMESFGFFSERKPRKSNLLAAKKISETFHIIANENDDIFYGPKQRMTKKLSPNENKKNDAPVSIQKSANKTTKKSKKNKNDTETGPCYCYVCKKTFYRPDNYLRHQMTLLHISKLSEVEMKVRTNPIIEEPNYLVAFRDQINRLKELALKLAAEKKKKNKIKMPSLDMILETVNKVIKKQKLQQRGLSTDQALFLDCCELLKESHKSEVTKQESIILVNEMHDNLCSSQTPLSEMDIIEKTNNDGNADSKSECDSITAKSILESEEVRNLENDLISGLKEAAKINRRISKNIHCQQNNLPEASNECFSTLNIEERELQVDHFDLEEPELNKSKKNVQTKTKMYPDVEDIDIFEDKFDKIKRKCRSQAAAAKQTQSVIETSPGHKIRKKIDTKKGKRVLKKNYQSTVLTKGALKGFDGIKVSIPTSEITVPGINVSLSEVSPKKKKRKFLKKNREKKDSESSTKYDIDSRMKEGLSLQRKHDVYEFMDNEDAELFEFRPSTLMERFKSIHSKEYHLKDSPKLNASVEDAANTSESGSDEDDFVYMSDDYVCSDDETENSLLSCEISNLKTETKKIFTPPKRKDAIEKNAVMGKIFKHNAVRSEKKETKAKDTDKPKTNLDQLFDSLLEDEPVSSTINNEESSSRVSDNEDLMSNNFVSLLSNDVPKENITSSYLKNNDSSYSTEWESPSTSKQEEFDLLAEPSTSKGFAMTSKKPVTSSTPKVLKNDIETNDKFLPEKSPNKELQEDFCNEAFDETGVARQRARRKCTVGKQNVLAETWSSESEPDGVPIRSNSAESLVITASRKKKGKKREGNQSSVRRGSRPLSNKKQDDQSRANSSSRKILTSSATGTIAAENLIEIPVVREIENKGQDQVDMQSSVCVTSPETTAQQGPIVAKGQSRSATSYWSPGGATEQEHIQQHGWIVGDSHKKLVTMLAHAKGRKRHNDDERHLIE